jgi:mannose-6-phosphate isomerase-like protein (cupin superfamily)
MLKQAKRQAKNAARDAARDLTHRVKFKVVDLRRAIKDLRQLNPEIRYTGCFEAEPFTSGLIAFRPRKNSDPKQIKHDDKDVLCYVVKGRGRLRLNRRRIELRPGMICHIPKGYPHDFAAGKRGELVLFYLLIKTG